MADVFHDQLIASLPKLRVQALGLTRDRSAADDLVQETVTKALTARDSFIPGTNFNGWIHTILRNNFISNVRKRRPTTDLENVPEGLFAVNAGHDDKLVLKELGRAVNRLPTAHREALFMIVLQNMSYEEAAEAAQCAVGTMKSRVFRARQQLQTWMMGEERKQPAQSKSRAALRTADSQAATAS